MSDSRIPRFELHIRPLMRLLDREKMLAVAGFDLWRYEDVRDEAEDILTHIKEDMPPRTYGGPWPQEWIDLFERWTETGFGRLELGQTDSDGYRAQRRELRVTITARGVLPDERYRFWLELESMSPETREYGFYFEPPLEPAGASLEFGLRERFRANSALRQVVIHDAAGIHELRVEAAHTPA